jgi:hypothetical protein
MTTRVKIAMLLLSVFLVVFGAQLIADWSPFPQEVTSARPSGQSGLFIDTPQTLMAWGVIYFFLITVCEIMIFRKAATNEDRSGEKPVMTGVPT